MTTERIEEMVNRITNEAGMLIDGTGTTEEVEKVAREALTTIDREAREEEHQFFLNVLDGIDIADEQMQNKGGGTKAIRFALHNRIITPNPPSH